MGEEDTEYLKLPVEERCVHKLWKARQSGYEEANKLFQQWDEKAPEFSKYLGLMKKFATDSNAVAQEKGLEAVLSYVENSAVAGKTVGEVMSGIVNKCIAAPKAKTKDLAIQITLMYIEIERHEVVIEELLKGLEQKNPKAVAGCISAVTLALHEFGHKVINIKPLVKKMPVILEDRDKTVREEGKKMVVEMYRWVRNALKPQLEHLKPVQLSELETEFEKVSDTVAHPNRYLRSQKPRAARTDVVNGCGEADDNEEEIQEEEEKIDPYDLMEPVDILSKLPKDFYEKTEAKKWQERKEAMDVLEELVKHPKLENGDYGDLIRTLKRIIGKDSNIMIVTQAAKCLGCLARGLKKRFSPYAVSCVSTVLEKFKEKKPTVVTVLRDTIDAMFPATNLEAIQEDVFGALENKNPSIKAESAAFVARCFAVCSPAVLTKKLLKSYITLLLKTLSESDPTVRDNSAEAIGVALKVVGEKTMTPYLTDIDNIKLTKIKEYAEKAVVVAVKTKKSTSAAVQQSAPSKVQAEVQSRPVIKKPTATDAAKPHKKAPVAKKTAGSATFTKKPKEQSVERELPQEEVDERAAELLPADVVSGLSDGDWKARLAATEQFMQTIGTLDCTDSQVVQILTRTLMKKPGLKENNFQVLKLKLDAVKTLSGTKMQRRTVEICLPDIVDKLGDTKNGAAAADVLTAMSEAVKFDFVSTEVMNLAFAQKSPKVQAEAMIWMSTGIKEFGFGKLQSKFLLDYVKKALSAQNPSIRTAGINLLGTLSMYIGSSTVRMLFSDEKSTVLQQIDAELEKYTGVQPPAPIRGTVVGKAAEGDAVDEDEEVPTAIQDLVPRADVSGEITDSLLEELGDKNWKTRNEALAKVTTILAEAKFVTPNLSELPAALNARLTDSNKNIATTALSICQTLGVALGPHCKNHVRTLVPGMLRSLGDNKASLRANTISCMNTWLEHCRLIDFFAGEAVADALKTGTPFLKADLFTWLVEKMPNAKPTIPKEDLSICLPYLYAAIEDRNADVRKAAQEVVLPFMIHMGYDSMAKATSKLKPGSKNLVVGVLDKAKPNVPAKPPPKSKSVPSGGRIAQPSGKAGISQKSDSVETNPSRGKVLTRPAKSKASPSKGKSSAGRKKDEDIDTSPMLPKNGQKQSRFVDEQKLKVLKWNFTTPREEFVELLREQMTSTGFNRNLISNMFHADFKFHLKAIDMLSEDLANDVDALVANLDLVLKWLTLRFFDTNPSVLLKGLDYLQNVFNLLGEIPYFMHDIEVASFVPYLVLKAGDPKDTVRHNVRTIFKQLCVIVPASKMFVYIMDGLKSKNARQRAECLEELGDLIERYGVSTCQPSPSAALKEIAKQISDRDQSVRNAALNTVVQAYYLEGDKVYKMVGSIADKDMSLLEERIKRACKNRPVGRPLPIMANEPKVVVRGGGGRSSAAISSRDSKIYDDDNEMRGSPSRSSRPVSGAFSLYCEELDKEFSSNPMPSINLYKYDSEILKPQAILMPRIRANPTLASKGDSSHLDLMTSQIGSPDFTTCLNALKQLDTYLKNDDNATSVVNRVDHILMLVVMQFRYCYNTRMSDATVDKQDVVEIYRILYSILVSLFHSTVLAKQGSKDVIHGLMDVLLNILMDKRNEELETTEVVRGANVAIVKIVDKADHTTVLTCAVNLLYEAVGKPTISPRYIELVMKCMWKIVRLIPDWMDDLDVDAVLYELHVFLRDYPSSWWKMRSDDMPLRTVKTVIHTLSKQLGNKIMSHLTKIDNSRESEMETYLLKILKSSGKEKRQDSKEDITNGKSPQAKKSQRRLSKSMQDNLTDIFRKIGTKELSKEGLQQLYDFKQQFPEADVEPYLSKSSKFFQDYIERGLQSIEAERQKALAANIPVNRDAPVLADLPPVPPSGTADTYLERIRLIRQRAGLLKDDEETQEMKMKTEVDEDVDVVLSPQRVLEDTRKFPVTVGRPTNTNANLADVEDLKKRLERIKNASR